MFEVQNSWGKKILGFHYLLKEIMKKKQKSWKWEKKKNSISLGLLGKKVSILVSLFYLVLSLAD